jgi:hypothetical protein
MSFLQKLQSAAADAVGRDADRWRLPLERVRGKTDFDGLERVSTQTILDLLEIPQRHRRAGLYRRLARVMTELGWRATRVRDLNGRGFREQVRGFCREASHLHRCRSGGPQAASRAKGQVDE